jgi:hypothetical protein
MQALLIAPTINWTFVVFVNTPSVPEMMRLYAPGAVKPVVSTFTAEVGDEPVTVGDDNVTVAPAGSPDATLRVTVPM